MKTGHFEMVVVLLAPMILMDILQVMLGMGSMWSLERELLVYGCLRHLCVLMIEMKTDRIIIS